MYLELGEQWLETLRRVEEVDGVVVGSIAVVVAVIAYCCASHCLFPSFQI